VKAPLATLAFVAAIVGATTLAVASEENYDLDNRMRAKIAKEKVKQAANERRLDKQGKGTDDNPTCGSQNIGNVDTGGRPGAAPREVFVFAPNAVNIVTRGGCR
jgi:hypothetical protein